MFKVLNPAEIKEKKKHMGKIAVKNNDEVLFERNMGLFVLTEDHRLSGRT